ncbi:uncharacterized protein LOC143297470 [Babylonia areolata]|uniref:uncharacterized protein LOC143297470 n=1 Tax=Babylonia areolata TaxID=304850 RepID=UPI003FD0F791
MIVILSYDQYNLSSAQQYDIQSIINITVHVINTTVQSIVQSIINITVHVINTTVQSIINTTYNPSSI